MLREKQKKEAIQRMNLLDLHRNIIENFRDKGEIYKSEIIGFSSLNKEEIEIIEKWENKTGYLVYHVVLGDMLFGKTMSILFVSDFEDEWRMEKDIMVMQDRIVAQVENLDYKELSEIGFIDIKKHNGRLIRIG